MLHPVAPEMAVLPWWGGGGGWGGGLVTIAACVCGHCLSDLNQVTPSEQFMNDFGIPKQKKF